MLDVVLTDAEEGQCRVWGLAINANKERHGMTRTRNNARYQDLDGDQNRINPLRSELAVAKTLGIPYGVAIHKGGDGGVDLRLPVPCRYGQTIQVKWRGERRRDLATETSGNLSKDLRADIYVLTWPGPEGCAVTLVGFATMEDWKKRIFSRPAVWMRGEKWELKWDSELRPMEMLIDAVAKVRAA